MKNKLSKFALAAFLSITAFTANADYTFSLLDMLGGTSSYAYGINNSGQIVGSISTTSGTSATLWSNGTITDLGALGGGSYSTAIGINASGQISGVVGSQGAIWNNGTLVTTEASATQFQGNVINNTGQVVFSNYAVPQRGLLWNDGTITELAPISGANDSQAKAINNSGQIVGSSFTTSGIETATLWSGGNVTSLVAVSGYANSRARAINDFGLVVGESSNADGSATGTATLWSNGVAINLGTLGGSSKANAINASGLIVGVSRDDTGSKRATLWDGTNIIDLNSFLDASTVNAGWVLKKAYDINDSGWIVGNAENSLLGISSAAFILTPVPEINTNAMLLMGLGLLGFMVGRKRI